MATATLEPFDDVIETQTRNVFHTLNEKDRRRFAAIQARQLGHGGITYISKLLTLSESTISRGIDELDTLPSQQFPVPACRCRFDRESWNPQAALDVQ